MAVVCRSERLEESKIRDHAKGADMWLAGMRYLAMLLVGSATLSHVAVCR